MPLVTCPGCGRPYAAARLEHGHTLWCACGTLVGMPPRSPRVDPDDVPRFAADASLVGLARWLRLLGHDCAHETGLAGELLVHAAVAERRVVLTRDRSLPETWRIADVHLVSARTTRAQLSEVYDRFALSGTARPLSRCARCNRTVRAVAARDATGRVPVSVLARLCEFLECPACHRVYWKGTHADAILRVAAQLDGS